MFPVVRSPLSGGAPRALPHGIYSRPNRPDQPPNLWSPDQDHPLLVIFIFSSQPTQPWARRRRKISRRSASPSIPPRGAIRIRIRKLPRNRYVPVFLLFCGGYSHGTVSFTHIMILSTHTLLTLIFQHSNLSEKRGRGGGCGEKEGGGGGGCGGEKEGGGRSGGQKEGGVQEREKEEGR